MQSMILVALLVAAASATGGQLRYPGDDIQVRSSSAARTIAIIRSINEAKEDGSFNYNFESEDGIKVDAAGSQKQVGAKADEIGTVQRGSYSYTAPDGVVITVNWIADENGFQPTGAHLPVAPPMPDYVVKMLADIKQREQQPAAYQPAPQRAAPSYPAAPQRAAPVYAAVAPPAPQRVAPTYVEAPAPAPQRVAPAYAAPAPAPVVEAVAVVEEPVQQTYGAKVAARTY